MPNRREFLAGALASGAATLVEPAFAGGAGPLVAPGAGTQAPVVLRGRGIALSASGREGLVAHLQRTTVAVLDQGRRRSRVIELAGQPIGVAVAPDGRTGAVTTAFWSIPGPGIPKPAVALIDIRSARLLARIDVGPAPGAVAFSADGVRLFVAGGEQDGALRVVDVARRSVAATVALGRVPRGLAVLGETAWVALNGESSVARVDLARARVTSRIATPEYPAPLAISARGERVLVGHRGGATEIATRTRRARHLYRGLHPSAVAYAGATRLLALGQTHELLAIDASGRRRSHAVAPGPRGLAVAGGRAFTVSGLTGAITAVRP